jgi:hypothetical protein
LDLSAVSVSGCDELGGLLAEQLRAEEVARTIVFAMRGFKDIAASRQNRGDDRLHVRLVASAIELRLSP